MRRLVLITAGLALVIAGCTNDPGASAIGSVTVGTTAPKLPATADWLNAPSPDPGADLTGKVTLIHFWRQSCLSCLDTVADIETLQGEFGNSVTIIGVHSPKFPREVDTEVVRGAVQRREYPGFVVNDSDRAIWNEWGIQAWPTIAVVDGEGNLAGGHVGLGAAEALRPLVADLVAAASGTPVVPAGLGNPAPTVLSNPEGVLADAEGNRLFIADTGHHRIVVAALDSYEVLAVIGDGTAASDDGPATGASFNTPRGMALYASTLYIADSGNHLIRGIDLNSFEVTTVAGTGEQSLLNTPWDIVHTEAGLVVSLAGANQLVLVDLEDGEVRPYAGSGRQGTGNGEADEAEFAMPTGLALDAAGSLYVADAESSTIRSVTSDGTVGHIAGGTDGLFEFGDTDATGADARLQHPLGMAIGAGAVWVADTYNSKIKRISLIGEVETLVGGEGWRDGASPLFAAPADLDVANGLLYVADRDNHSVRVIDPATGAASTVILEGIERLVPTDAEFDGRLVVLDPVEVGEGAGTLTLDVTFPPGYKANELALSRFEWTAAGDAVATPEAADVSVAGPAFPMQFEFTFATGEGRLQGNVWLVYCESIAESICLFDRARIEVPLVVTSGGPTDIAVAYEVTLPDGL